MSSASCPAVCGALALLAFVSCRNDLNEIAAVVVPGNAPDRVTKHAEYYYSDSGYVHNRLRAGIIQEFMGPPRRTEMSEGVELLFYSPTGQPGSVLTARKGSILPEEHRMQVEEQVVFVNPKGERLETEMLVWQQDSDRVYTDRPVRVVRAEDIIYGDGLDASADFSSYSVRHITGMLAAPANDSLTP
jgi:LPS export ABC transporter protein LptC